MAWLKARLWDVITCTLFLTLLFGCNKERQSCKNARWADSGASAEAQAMPSPAELRGIALDCAASRSAAGCADPLLDQIDMADELGCSKELDDLMFCVEDGNAREKDGTIEWACDSQERVYRACAATETASAK